MIPAGAIDCDIHPAVPKLTSLVPYLEPHWAESVAERGINELDTIAYPLNAPLTARPDWRQAGVKPGADLDALRRDALDAFGTRFAICNCLYGVPVMFSEDMGAAFARGLNDWMAREWLDRDDRLRASIVAPLQSAERAAAEIERCAADPRFVQVLLPGMADAPLGHRSYWPIYAAAEKHGLPVCIHAGSTYRHPVTPMGWPSYYTEDYIDQAQGLQSQLTSLVCEGVFSRFPGLTVVFAESGFTWLPAFLWRLTKFWRGLRREIPWVDRPPTEIVRDQVRFTLQPIDAPPQEADLHRVFEHVGSDAMLLFSTDYPHWQFDGSDVLPPGISDELARRIAVDNPMRTYSRLQETVA